MISSAPSSTPWGGSTSAWRAPLWLLGELLLIALIPSCYHYGGLGPGEDPGGGSPPTALERARALEGEGRLREAQGIYERLLGGEDPEGACRATLGLARLADRGGGVLAALPHLERAAQGGGTCSFDGKEALARALFELSRYEGAARTARELLSLSTEAELLLLWGESAYQAGALSEAAEAFSKVVDRVEGADGRLARHRLEELILHRLSLQDVEALRRTCFGETFLALADGKAWMVRCRHQATRECQRDLERLRAANEELQKILPQPAKVGQRGPQLGALLPLSGRLSRVGHQALLGALLAVEAARDQGEEIVAVTVRDSQGDPEGARRGFNSLALHQNILAILGPMDSQAASVVAPLAQAASIPLVALTVHDEVSQHRDQIFRLFPTPPEEACQAARYGLDRLKARDAVILQPGHNYGKALAQAFERAWTQGGGQIVDMIPYKEKKTAFVDVAQRIARQEGDLLYVPDSPSTAVLLLPALAQADVWVRSALKKQAEDLGGRAIWVMGTSLWHHPHLLQRGSSYVEGVFLPVSYDAQEPSALNGLLVHKHQALFDGDPNYVVAFAYDGVRILQEAGEAAGLQRGKVAQQLLRVRGYEGATGKIVFDREGKACRESRFLTVVEGSFQRAP